MFFMEPVLRYYTRTLNIFLLGIHTRRDTEHFIHAHLDIKDFTCILSSIRSRYIYSSISIGVHNITIYLLYHVTIAYIIYCHFCTYVIVSNKSDVFVLNSHWFFIIQLCPTIKPSLNNRFELIVNFCIYMRLYYTLINCIRILWTVRASAFNQLTIVIDTAQAQLSVPPLRIITYRKWLTHTRATWRK